MSGEKLRIRLSAIDSRRIDAAYVNVYFSQRIVATAIIIAPWYNPVGSAKCWEHDINPPPRDRLAAREEPEDSKRTAPL